MVGSTDLDAWAYTLVWDELQCPDCFKNHPSNNGCIHTDDDDAECCECGARFVRSTTA
jgi:hypothetical protein